MENPFYSESAGSAAVEKDSRRSPKLARYDQEIDRDSGYRKEAPVNPYSSASRDSFRPFESGSAARDFSGSVAPQSGKSGSLFIVAGFVL
jgi:hypothetical protein